MLGYSGRYPAPSSNVTVSSPVSSATLSSTVGISTSTATVPAGMVALVGMEPLVYPAGASTLRLTVIVWVMSFDPVRDIVNFTGWPSMTRPFSK